MLHTIAEELAEKLTTHANVRCLVSEPLSKHTSFRVGGPAQLYVYPLDTDGLAATLQFCKENTLQKFIIGYGTNLLISDDGYRGCVIDLAECCRRLEVAGDKVTVGAGVWLSEAIRYAAERGVGGWSKLAGIPGGMGGALSMNAGAFRSSISEHLTEVDVMNGNGRTTTMTKEEVRFGYREAPGLRDKIALEARFQLPLTPREQALKAMEETITERYRRNVMVLPSAGSVFKNSQGHFAAQLIESVGGKGLREGGVEVSLLHANFIVNTRGGTAGDIVRLIGRIRQRVRERYGVHLELELRTLGFEEEVI